MQRVLLSLSGGGVDREVLGLPIYRALQPRLSIVLDACRLRGRL